MYNIKVLLIADGAINMKIVSLCREGSCCPIVKLTDKGVEIGEKGNICVLTKEQWETHKLHPLNRQTFAQAI